MFEELIESAAQKEKFRVAANKLLNQCFLLRKREDTKKEYVFVRQNRELFLPFFDLLGYDLKINEDQGVIGIVNQFGTGRLSLGKYESVFLLILRILYVEKRKELGTFTEEVTVLMEEIREKYAMLKIRARPMLDKGNERHMVSLFRLLLVVLFLGLWELAARKEWIDVFFFSSPGDIVRYLYQMLIDYSFFTNTGITLLETIVSFLLVTLLSLLVATLLWYVSSLAEILEPYLVVLNSLPKSALAPLLIVWLGTGTNTIIVAGISVAVFGSIINLYTGFCQSDPEMLKLIYTLGGNRRDALLKVILPGSVPLILSNMKVNIGLALVGVIIGEFLAARRGLGYLIIYGSQVFQLNMVITSIIILCAIAMIFYQLIQRMEHYYRKKF